jgi:hypothetical protein
MFIRQKGKSFYLVENKRDAGKVRQRTVCYLGPCDNLPGALAHWETVAEGLRLQVAQYRAFQARARGQIHPDWLQGGEVPPRLPGCRFTNDPSRRFWSHKKYADRLEAKAREAEERVSKLQTLVAAHVGGNGHYTEAYNPVAETLPSLTSGPVATDEKDSKNVIPHLGSEGSLAPD